MTLQWRKEKQSDLAEVGASSMSETWLAKLESSSFDGGSNPIQTATFGRFPAAPGHPRVAAHGGLKE
jgi:hypothetical protein